MAVRALAALAQETRLDVFRLLVQAGPAGMPAGDVSVALGLAPATLSFHLKELRSAGLVRDERAGRLRIYRPDFDTAQALIAYLTEDCCRGFAVQPSCEQNSCGDGAGARP